MAELVRNYEVKIDVWNRGILIGDINVEKSEKSTQIAQSGGGNFGACVQISL